MTQRVAVCSSVTPKDSCVGLPASAARRSRNQFCFSMCCSGLQRVALWCSLLQCDASCCSVLQCVALCCSVTSRDSYIYIHLRQRRVGVKTHYVLQCVAVCCSVLQCVAVCCSVMQRVAVCCTALLCVAVCCSMLQCVACYSAWNPPRLKYVFTCVSSARGPKLNIPPRVASVSVQGKSAQESDPCDMPM